MNNKKMIAYLEAATEEMQQIGKQIDNINKKMDDSFSSNKMKAVSKEKFVVKFLRKIARKKGFVLLKRGLLIDRFEDQLNSVEWQQVDVVEKKNGKKITVQGFLEGEN